MENDDIRRAGIRQLVVDFKIRNNTSVEIFIGGIDIASNRVIKYNNFYSSGDNVELEDLGGPTVKKFLVELE